MIWCLKDIVLRIFWKIGKNEYQMVNCFLDCVTELAKRDVFDALKKMIMGIFGEA